MKLDFKLPKLPKLSEIRMPSLPLDLRKVESFDKEHYRVIAYGLGAVIVLMVLAGFSAFFLSLKGAEQTLVPDVKGMELAQALEKLQDKELYPRVSLRYTNDPQLRGEIIDQDPAAGSIVKAGRRIQLTVSRGAVVGKVEKFVGLTVDDARIHIQALFAGTTALLAIKDPPVYVYDKAPAGTILEQKPLPDTAITGPTQLELVVSRGPDKVQVAVPELVGLSIDQASAIIQSESSTMFQGAQKTNLVFDFSMRAPGKSERAGIVVAQTPAPGSMIATNSRVSLTLTNPAPAEGKVAGIFSRDLIVYPYPVKVSLVALSPEGEKTPIFTVNHPGGAFTAPYVAPAGSALMLFVLDREVLPRFEVAGTAEQASP
jgi:beta-lactam-binding protein with PASTA domain